MSLKSTLTLLFTLSLSSAATWASQLKLWYDAPASEWVEALPLGNSRLGMMVYGSPAHEEIQLNEETLWGGSPHTNHSARALKALPEVRRLVFAGRNAEAQALIDTYNCCVISQHCDSAQPQLVAAENNVFGCGYNSDMTEQAPTAHLTSAIWHWNVYYETAIKAAMDCNGDASKFVENMGGNAYYAGLAEGFVDASPLNEAVAAPNTKAVMDAVRELMVSGEWDVFSGVKLSYNISEDGKVEIVRTDAPLMSDGKQLVDGALVDMEPEIVPAGGPSVDDGVIKGSMNYNVAGVIEG